MLDSSGRDSPGACFWLPPSLTVLRLFLQAAAPTFRCAADKHAGSLSVRLTGDRAQAGLGSIKGPTWALSLLPAGTAPCCVDSSVTAALAGAGWAGVGVGSLPWPRCSEATDPCRNLQPHLWAVCLVPRNHGAEVSFPSFTGPLPPGLSPLVPKEHSEEATQPGRKETLRRCLRAELCLWVQRGAGVSPLSSGRTRTPRAAVAGHLQTQAARLRADLKCP